MKSSSNINETFLFAALLSLVGGFQDAYSYVGRQHVFANAQTGNLILLGLNAISGNISGMFRYLLPLSFFALGILTACILREKSKNGGQSLHWHQKVLILEILFLLSNAFIPLGKYDILANSLISLSCAIQVEAFQHFININAATTMCIGNIKNGMEHLFQFFINKDLQHLKKSLIYIGIIFFFGAGAVIGIICTNLFKEKAIYACIVLLIFLIFLIQAKRPESQIN